MSNDGRNTAA